MFATVQNPSSSSRNASSRWATRSPAGSPAGVGDPNAPRIHPPTPRPHQQRPLLTEQPDAQLPPLDRQPRPAHRLPVRMAEQVTEQPQSHPPCLPVTTGRSRRALLTPDWNHGASRPSPIEHRDRPRMSPAPQGHRKSPRLEPDQHPARRHERKHDRRSPRRPQPLPRQRARIEPPPPRQLDRFMEPPAPRLSARTEEIIEGDRSLLV